MRHNIRIVKILEDKLLGKRRRGGARENVTGAKLWNTNFKDDDV